MASNRKDILFEKEEQSEVWEKKVSSPPIFVQNETVPNSGYNNKYNSKSWQDELGLNVYAYGWRDYDPAIGRFQKLDRFSEKYYKLSPYGYAGNNPVLINDIQGDSLWISFGKNEKVLYENGNLLSKGSDGKFSAYKGSQAKIDKKTGNVKGYRGFLGQAKNALDKISKGEGEIGTNVVSTLQSSNNNFNIVESTSNSFDPRGSDMVATRINDASYQQGVNLGRGQIGGSSPSNIIGSGGNIYWNPNSSVEIATNKGLMTADPTQVLAHELFHGYDSNFGNLTWSRYPDAINGTEIKEIRAVHFFNQLGGTQTFNTGHYQTHYNSDRSGYYLLDSNGQPRTVSPTILWDK